MRKMASVLHTKEGTDALGLGVVVVVVVVVVASAGFCRCKLRSSLIGDSTAGIVSLPPEVANPQLDVNIYLREGCARKHG